VSFDPEFLTMMPSTMRVFPFITFDTYGEPSYSTAATNYRCRIEPDGQVVKDQLGKDIVLNVTAYVASTSALNVLSNYILPDGSTGIVISISPVPDEDGIHHNVVRLGG
jgi:hypothetical protein